MRTDAGIEQPGDLRGKKVGVPEYQQTANVWTRGIRLEEIFAESTLDLASSNGAPMEAQS